MPFSYYARLSRSQQAIYRKSDEIVEVRLPQPAALHPAVESLTTALASEDRVTVQHATDRLIRGLTDALGLPAVEVQVLAARPHAKWGELHGLYTVERGKTPTIQLWMRTAKQRRVVAFRTYLRTPAAHHAFVAAAVEAARHYPGSAVELVALFARIRGDQLLRRFLAPKILESLYVLGDPAALPLLEELLVAGHTDPDPDRCEVTRALVAVRKLTGRVAPSAKFPDPADSAVARSLDEAERRFEAERDQLLPVTVI